MKNLKLELPDASAEVLISAKVNEELKNQVQKKIKQDQASGRRVSMRAIIEAGFRSYLGRKK